MNVYIETNFILELVFLQEQNTSCENILTLCDTNDVNLFIPAYCLVEPHEKLRRQNRSRQELQRVLNAELKQLARTSSYAERIQSIQDVATLFIQSSKEERLRFIQIQQQILDIGSVIPLTASVLNQAASSEKEYDLSPQDAVVFASVISYLEMNNQVESCFLNKNSRDFDNPDIVDKLEDSNCKMIPKFEDGYRFIQSRM